MRTDKESYIIKYKLEDKLYLGKVESQHILTTSNSKGLLIFPNHKKAVKYLRSANYKDRYFNTVFEIVSLSTQIISKNNDDIFSHTNKKLL